MDVNALISIKMSPEMSWVRLVICEMNQAFEFKKKEKSYWIAIKNIYGKFSSTSSE